MRYLYDATINDVVQKSLDNNKGLNYDDHVQWCLEQINGITDIYGDSCVRSWIDDILKNKLLSAWRTS